MSSTVTGVDVCLWPIVLQKLLNAERPKADIPIAAMNVCFWR